MQWYCRCIPTRFAMNFHMCILTSTKIHIRNTSTGCTRSAWMVCSQILLELSTCIKSGHIPIEPMTLKFQATANFALHDISVRRLPTLTVDRRYLWDWIAPIKQGYPLFLIPGLRSWDTYRFNCTTSKCIKHQRALEYEGSPVSFEAHEVYQVTKKVGILQSGTLFIVLRNCRTTKICQSPQWSQVAQWVVLVADLFT